MLVVSSTDGFASVVAFDEGELGAPETNIPEHVKSLLASSRIGESVPDEVVVVAPAVPNPVAAGPGPTRIAPVRIAPTPM
jgi:chromatin assembly factor 1 subunit B